MLALTILPDDSISRVPNLALVDNEPDQLLQLWSLRSNLNYLKYSTRKGILTEHQRTPILFVKGDAHSHGLLASSNLLHNDDTNLPQPLSSPTSFESSYNLFDSAATNSLTNGTSPDGSQCSPPAVLCANRGECSLPNPLRFLSDSDSFPATNGLTRSPRADRSQHPQMPLADDDDTDDDEHALPNPPSTSCRTLESTCVTFRSTTNGTNLVDPRHFQALRTYHIEHSPLNLLVCRPPHSTASSEFCSDSFKSIANILPSNMKLPDFQLFRIRHANSDKGELVPQMRRPLSGPTSCRSSLYSFRSAVDSPTSPMKPFAKGTNLAESLSSSFQLATGYVPAHLSPSKADSNPIQQCDFAEIGIIDGEAYMPKSESPYRSNSLFSHSETGQTPLPASPLHNESLLTADIDTAVNEATSLYESIRLDHVSSPTEVGYLIEHPCISEAQDLLQTMSNPFTCCSFEELEHQYSVAVDAKNALAFRQMAILADIGIFLELLAAKIHVYTRDRVTLTSAYEDLRLIRQECSRKKLRVNFEYLEWYRLEKDRSGLGFVDENRHQTFSWQEKKLVFEDYRIPRAAALQFLRDPVALIEARLPRSAFQK